MSDNTLYGYALDEHEFRAEVPPMMITGDRRIVIGLSAHGGGTVGKAYADNGWDYVVYVSTPPAHLARVISGSDLRSAPARAAGHLEMARTLCAFLAAAGESLHWSGDDSRYAAEYPDGPARDFLAAEYERLSLVSDEETSDDDALIILP